MKTMKKLASAALALILTLALAVPAMAAGEGTITVNNAVPEQTYTIYRIFDLSFDGKEAHTYTVNAAWTEFINQTTIDGVYVDVDEQGYVTWHQTEVDGKLVDADPAAFAKLALAYAQNNSIENQGTEKAPAAAEGETTSKVEFTGLELGYYLIDSSLGALCALDTTNKAANVTEKNEKPTDKKESEMPEDSKVGSAVAYTITINAKKGAQAYKVHDTMSASLDFDPTSLVVTATPVVAEGETATTVTLTKDTHYTLIEAPTDGCTFEVNFDQAYLDTLAGDTTILLTYNGIINANAVIGKDPITNKEILDYGDGNHTQETPGTTTKDKFYDFDLVKTNSKNELLANAVFQLKDNNGDVINLVRNADGTYRPAVAADTETVDQITTAADSKITFAGFAPGSYTLEEVSAPNGYNKLKAPVAIQIIPKMENGEEVLDADGFKVMDLVVDTKNVGSLTATITPATTEGEGETAVTTPATIEGGVHITNYTGMEMPETGGIGTTIFYVVGGLLVVGAGVLLVTKRRMSGEEE